MNYFNIDIDKVILALKDLAEANYINQCNDPEKDDDGTSMSPSLERAIETVLESYFDENYGEIPEEFSKEHEEIYNRLNEKLSNELNEDDINNLLLEIKENYKGLSEYERNSGKY